MILKIFHKYISGQNKLEGYIKKSSLSQNTQGWSPKDHPWITSSQQRTGRWVKKMAVFCWRQSCFYWCRWVGKISHINFIKYCEFGYSDVFPRIWGNITKRTSQYIIESCDRKCFGISNCNQISIKSQFD